MAEDGEISPDTATEPLVIAIDAGTSSIRCLVYDAAGRRLPGLEAHQPYAIQTSADGGVWADPDLLVDLTFRCLDSVVTAMRPTGRRPAAVALDTFWHSMMGVDGHGCPTVPVLTWADTRSAAAARGLQERLDERRVHARTGTGLHSSYWPAKLAWLRETQTDTVARTARWLGFGEYLYMRLFGEQRVSISMASATGLFNQQSCRWDDELLAALDLHQERLPPVAEYKQAMSRPAAEFVRRWPELATVPWFLALGDGACNNVGSGGFDERRVVLMVGTSGALRVVRAVDQVVVPDGLWSYRIDGHRVVQGGALSAGGNVFAWLTNTLHLPTIADLEDDLLKMKPDGHGLTVLPFLAGERSPYWNLHAQAAMVGMTLDTTAEDIVRASLEAISYRFALVLDILQGTVPALDSIIGSGAGLIHSPAWLQIMADVLGKKVITSAVPEATSRGSALLALEALSVIDDAGSLPVPLGDSFSPVLDNTAIYRTAMERQRRLYEQIIP